MVSGRLLAAMIVNLLMIAAVRRAATMEIVVEPRRVRVGESVTVTLRLEGDWARIRDVSIPVRNLELGRASTYSEYGMVNGRTSRAKTFRWIAQPVNAGLATVGPLVLSREGRTLRLAAVDVVVTPDNAAPPGAPGEVLEQLESDSRDRLFVVATADRTTAFVGEPIVVTWHLYALESLRRIRAAESPQLADFWSEVMAEPAGEPEWVMIGSRRAQRYVLRKSALFPTRSGTLTIPPLTVAAEIVEPIVTPLGRIGSWEGVVKDVKRRSSPIVITARPLPSGVDAVGDLTLRVTPPRGGAGGAASFDATLHGNGNLRSIEPPRFIRPPDARVEIEDLVVTVDR
ncbi:MAG: BatD family protein, partial [Thermoanaerobaculia bacterium]